MKYNFIELTLGHHIISHGYDMANKEITEQVEVDQFSKKLINFNLLINFRKNWLQYQE